MTIKLTKKNLLQSSSFVLQLTLSITLLITTVLKNWCSLNIDETEAVPSHGYFDHGLNYYTCIRIWWRKHLQNYRDCCSECLSPSFVSAVIRIVFFMVCFFLLQFTAPEQSGYVGFANLPNQVHRKSVKKGFEFTLMVVGK